MTRPAGKGTGQPATSRQLALAGVVRPKLVGSAVTDPREAEADSVAEAVTSSASASGTLGTAPAAPLPPPDPPARAAAGLVTSGSRLSPDLSADLGARFGRDLSGVRIHTDALAGAAVQALDARAFAVGSDIAFGAGEYAPGTQAGRTLLAHELAHVTQPHRPPGVAFRQPKPDSLDDPPAVLPVAPVYGPEYVKDITVDDPRMVGERQEKQTFRLHLQVEEPHCDLKYWVVPVAKLRLPPTPTVTPPVTPTVTPTVTPQPVVPAPVAGVPPQLPPAHPAIAPGATVQTLDGAKLTALASTPEHVITAEYTKFAVGAASTSALRLADGSVIIIDAGVNAKGIGTTMLRLEALTMQALETFIGKGVVREILISHAHGDHFSMAPAIMRRFVVQIVRMNDVMRRWRGAKPGREAMKAGETARIAEAEQAFNRQMTERRAAWDAAEGSGFAPDARELAWRRHVRLEFEKTPQSKPAIERVLVQSKGGLDVVDFDLATGERRGGPTPFQAEDPYSVAETQKTIESRRVLDRRRKTEARDIDPNASAFVITVKDGMSILVLPDLRARDLDGIKEKFAKAMGQVKRPVHIWDVSHHLQKGWYNIAGTAPASQLATIADFLMTFRSSGDADAVVVSAQIDMANPNAKTLVDPVNLRLLRSLGFEVYLAASGREVRVVDITTAQGTKLTGILGTRAPGQGDPKLSVRRATLALEKLAAERQARLVAAKEETNATTKAEIERRIAEIKTVEAEVKAALTETYTEMEVNVRRAGGNTTASLAQPQINSFPKQLALDQLLERHGFDMPTVKSLHLSEMALVVINRAPDFADAPAGSPGSRARQLAAVRSRINEIGVRLKAGAAPIEVHASLLVEYETYRTLLENELSPADPAQRPIEGTSKSLLTADLADVKSRIASITEGPGTTEYSRAVGKGDLVAQHATVLKPLETGAPKVESPTMQGARKVAGAVGKGSGVIMIATTVTGEGELLARWKQGKATGKEAAIGSMKNIASGGIGLMMLRGMDVHPAAFVIIAALEVGEAAWRHYDTEEQHDIGMYQAAASAGINLACMGIGMALMAIPTPVTFIGGLILSTIAPLLLKAFGIDEKIAEWAERRGAFNPSEVVEVLQTLRKLLKSYQLVVGSIQLAKRATDPTDPTFSRLPDAATRAEGVRKEESRRAFKLEQEILGEFEKAYRDGKTNYAGLKDLDTYRAQFYALRREARLSGAAELFAGAFGIRAPDNVFKAIDATMSMDTMTGAEIMKMPQWTHLDDELDDLLTLINADRDSDYHSKVRDKDKRLQAMVDNARYRLNPTADAHERATAMLTPGTPARRTYEDMLATREWNLARRRRLYVEKTSALCGLSMAPGGVDPKAPMSWPLMPDWAMSMAEGSIKAYRLTVEHSFGPPKQLVSDMWTHSQGAEDYRAFVAKNGFYRDQLERLETTERMIEGQLSQAKRTSDAEPESLRAGERKRIQTATETMKEARTTRYAKRGMLFLSEVDGLRTDVWKDEVSKIQPLFAAKDRLVTPLTEAEELALVARRTDFESDERVRQPLSRRMSIVRSPTAVDAQGNLANVFRLTGEVPINLQYATKPVVHVVPEMNALVGVVAAPQFGGANNERSTIFEVMPLNDRAIEVFKRDRGFLVYRTNLAPVTAAELERATAALAATAKPATP